MTCGLMTMKVSITLVFFRAAYSERKKKKFLVHIATLFIDGCRTNMAWKAVQS